MHNELIEISEARRLLSTCTDLRQIKEISDKAAAVKVYLKASGESLGAQNHAAEIHLLADRRAGEILAGMEKRHGGHAMKARSHDVTEVPPSLADIGINKKQSSRLQDKAAVPEKTFQAWMRETKEKSQEITSTGLLRLAKEGEREAARKKNKALVDECETLDVISGKFHTIVVDPPWDWDDEGDHEQLGRGRHTYSPMSFDDLLAFPIAGKAESNCHLYLWITNRSLPKGFPLLEAWGFRYVTCLTWCKPSIGIGNYFRGSTEQILFGVQGKQSLLRQDVGTWFEAKRGKQHSTKPDAFYDLIETCSPGPFLDVFSRRKRNGWTVWGAEA